MVKIIITVMNTLLIKFRLVLSNDGGPPVWMKILIMVEAAATKIDLVRTLKKKVVIESPIKGLIIKRRAIKAEMHNPIVTMNIICGG